MSTSAPHQMSDQKSDQKSDLPLSMSDLPVSMSDLPISMSDLSLSRQVSTSTEVTPPLPSLNSGLVRTKPLHQAATFPYPDMCLNDMDKLNPFELVDTALIREWYYCFKKKFLRKVRTGHEYCTLSLDQYRQRFQGLPAQIEHVVYSVEVFFSQCLHRLLEDFVEPNLFLSREYVENELLEKLEKMENEVERLVKIAMRQNELLRKAVAGDFRPLLNHLLAYSASPEDIWQTFIRIFVSLVPESKLEQVMEFAGSITEAKEHLPDVSKQISWWYSNTEDKRRDLCNSESLKKGPKRRYYRKKKKQNQKAQVAEEHHKNPTMVHLAYRTMDGSNTREGHYSEPNHYLFYESVTGQKFLINPDDDMFDDDFSSEDGSFSD